MFRWLKELLTIYTWKEFWIVISFPSAIMGIWLLFCFLLTIPSTIIRATSIWTLIVTLWAGSITVDALRKRSEDRTGSSK